MTYQLTRGRCACGRRMNSAKGHHACWPCRKREHYMTPCIQCGKASHGKRCQNCLRYSNRQVAAVIAYNNGAGLSEIARALKITRQRVEQMVKPLQSRARHRLHRALNRGGIIRPSSCERCGAGCQPHGHHDDYRQALAVKWLCPPCHRLNHTPKSSH